MKAAALLSVLILLVAPQDDAKIRVLLERLDDDSIDVRTQSAAALVELGPSATPALKAALVGASGEFRERLIETLRKIRDRERLAALLPEPSRISIEAERRPLRDVLKRLARQSKTPIDYSAVPEQETVSVVLEGVPFWKALDHICRTNGHVMADVEAEKVVIRPEAYIPLPGRISDRFWVSLQSVDLTDDGSFGQQDRYERFGALLHVAWEKGVRPYRVSAHLLELVDEHGKELVSADDEDGVTTSSISPDAIRQELGIASEHGPGPHAMKLGRLRAAVELEFPLKSATVSFDLAAGKAPQSSDCAEFSSTLLDFRKSDGVVTASISFVVRPPLESIVSSESIFLRDAAGHEFAAAAQGSTTTETGTVYQVIFPGAAEQTSYTQIVVRVPSEVHRERIEIDLKDLPLK